MIPRDSDGDKPRPDEARGPRETFLKLFPPLKRGAVANDFLFPVRYQGARTPAAVLSHVVDKLQRSIASASRWGRDDRAEELEAKLDTIIAHEPEALALAAWALAYAALPDEERQRIKHQRSREHLNRWMGERAPSEKQLAYLRALGYRGAPPATMLEASHAIEQLKTRKAARHEG